MVIKESLPLPLPRFYLNGTSTKKNYDSNTFDKNPFIRASTPVLLFRLMNSMRHTQDIWMFWFKQMFIIINKDKPTDFILFFSFTFLRQWINTLLNNHHDKDELTIKFSRCPNPVICINLGCVWIAVYVIFHEKNYCRDLIYVRKKGDHGKR